MRADRHVHRELHRARSRVAVADYLVFRIEIAQDELVHHHARYIEDDYPRQRVREHYPRLPPVFGGEAQVVVGYHYERLVQPAQEYQDDAEIVAGDARRQRHVVFVVELLVNVVRSRQILARAALWR